MAWIVLLFNVFSLVYNRNYIIFVDYIVKIIEFF